MTTTNIATDKSIKMDSTSITELMQTQMITGLFSHLFTQDNIFSMKNILLLLIMISIDTLRPIIGSILKDLIEYIKTNIIFYKNSIYEFLKTKEPQYICQEVFPSNTSQIVIECDSSFIEMFYKWMIQNPNNCKYIETLQKYNLGDNANTIQTINYNITHILCNSNWLNLKKTTSVGFEEGANEHEVQRWLETDLSFNISKNIFNQKIQLSTPTFDKIKVTSILDIWHPRVKDTINYFKKVYTEKYGDIFSTINIAGLQVDGSLGFIFSILKTNYPNMKTNNWIDILILSNIISLHHRQTTKFFNSSVNDNMSTFYDPYHTYKRTSWLNYEMFVVAVHGVPQFQPLNGDIITSYNPNLIQQLKTKYYTENKNQNFNIMYDKNDYDDIIINLQINNFIQQLYSHEIKITKPINIYNLSLVKKIDKEISEPNPEFVKWQKKKELFDDYKNKPDSENQLNPNFNLKSNRHEAAYYEFINSDVPEETIKHVEYKLEIVKEHVNEVYKPFDTIYLQEDDHRKLTTTLDHFKNKKDLFHKFGFDYKLNLLLYGLPGCGKSTCIQVVATYLGKDIYYINLNNVSTNAELKMLCEYVVKNVVNGGVIVMEDFDAMTNIALKRTKDYKNTEIKNGLTLEYFLNLLQGTLTMKESIFIITTNHIDHLDPAFYRDARFDQRIEFKLANHFQIKTIYQKLLDKEIPDEVLKRIPQYKYSPAKIIYLLKEYIFNPDVDPLFIFKDLIE